MKRLVIYAAFALLPACVSQGPRQDDLPLISAAEQRLAAKDYGGAAQIYQRLIEQSDAPDYYRLEAADAELKDGNGRAAQALLSAVDPEELRHPDYQRYLLLKSRIDLNQGRAREAMVRLDELDYQRMDPALEAQYHTLRASGYNQLGNMLESARERVELGRLLTRPEAIQSNNEAIYDALKRLPDRALAELQPPPPDELGGWMALTQVLRGPANQRPEALRGWRSQFLGHPADGPFLEGLLGKPEKAKPERLGNKPAPVRSEPVQVTPMTPPAEPVSGLPPAPGGRVVGVMLPLTGTYGPAGQAVKSGMEAAAAADNHPAKPQLRFSDTQGGDPAAIYRGLTGAGAELVVGPLIKEDLTALAKSAELTVPVLALNQVKEVQSGSIYQFGLTPEQEVEQSAGSAWFDGRQSALMLAPASAFGQRMIQHFTAYWRSLGGRVIAIKTYKAGGDDFSAPARELLAAAQAGGINADFLFLVADGRDGSLLKSYLEAQQGQGQPLPIYATSQIYNGRPDVPQNPDLSGIAFCDIPWLLDGGEAGPLSRQALQPALERTPENYRRLIPMGLDAYRLIGELNQLQASPQQRFNGTTGVLTLSPDNRIQRQLQCAQFDAGRLQPRGIAPLLQPGAEMPARDSGQ